jgi:hypothetical protein
MKHGKRYLVYVAAWLAAAGLCQATDLWNDEDTEKEEYAGAVLTVIANPVDSIYGVNGGWGMWIKNSPVFGDYFLGVFHNGIEDATYANFGMTVRVLPHWIVAPFVGVGGTFDLSIDSAGGHAPITAALGKDKGDSYWAGHAETGLRVSPRSWHSFFEGFGRYNWTTSDTKDSDYWIVGLTWGNRY